MAKPFSYNDIIGGIKAAMDTVPEIGLVDLTPGGASPWTKNGGKPDYHWWAEVFKTSQKITTIPGSTGTMCARKTTLVIVEGWFPVISAMDSHQAWRNKLDQVMSILETKRFLGMHRGLILELGPVIAADGEAMKTSLHQGDIAMLCHYAKIALKYSQEYQFTSV